MHMRKREVHIQSEASDRSFTYPCAFGILTKVLGSRQVVKALVFGAGIAGSSPAFPATVS